MKVKRFKHARKLLAFYRNSFGLHEPYQVLVDATFCQAAITCKIHIKEQLDKYLDAPTTLYTTPCVVDEVRRLGPTFAGAYLINRKYEHRRCGHDPGTTTARDCVKSVIGPTNRHRMLVATQDISLRQAMRDIPGIPLLYIDYHTVILENPSKATNEAADKANLGKMAVPEAEAKMLAAQNPPPLEPLIKHKYRKPKAPNPLSVRKKKGEVVPKKKKTTKKKKAKAEEGTSGPQGTDGEGKAPEAQDTEKPTEASNPPAAESTDPTATLVKEDTQVNGTKRERSESESEVGEARKKRRKKRGKKKKKGQGAGVGAAESEGDADQ